MPYHRSTAVQFVSRDRHNPIPKTSYALLRCLLWQILEKIYEVNCEELALHDCVIHAIILIINNNIGIHSSRSGVTGLYLLE